jgi:CDP-glycerol glycerophosphotransferase
VRIVYDSFHGRYSDNPRAVHERLESRAGLEHVWLMDPDHAAGFPATVATVDIFSPEAVAVLESADLVVANTHVELEWEKRPGTTYLQTWHGTPLKRIHRDVLWAPEGRLDRLDRDVAKWDLLLSPNEVSTPRLRQAFRYEGEVLESGYPRNDVLSSDRGDALRDVVRKDLGIDEGDRVVLYTPTWRDDECFAEGSPEVRLGMDVERFVAELGEDHVLLVRSHNMVTGRSRIATTPRVLDVSLHPDVRDLYLAADVLVTDYSSTMFDFAITGRPVLFLAYDLERFQDSIRGFYFDFLPVAPGPVVRSTDELVAELRELGSYAERYAERYADFRGQFTALEDGRATDRVLSRLGLTG